MVPFSYGNEGKIFEIFEPYQSFQEPRKAIPAEITAITGINQNMVSGHRFDRELIKNYLAQADILIAHNAAFDRKFMEKLFEQACAKPGRAQPHKLTGELRVLRALDWATLWPLLDFFMIVIVH